MAKPQTAWALQVKFTRITWIVPGSVRSLRKDAVSAFWRDYKNTSDETHDRVLRQFRDGTYRFVKVQIVPVTP